MFVTPNRLTFGPAEEIIDPYHYVEYDAGRATRAVRSAVLPASRCWACSDRPRYQALIDAERRQLDRLLAFDPLRLRRLVPRRAAPAAL